MNEQKLYPWASGLPTRPDVDALLKAFPPEGIGPGFFVSDEDIASVIGLAAGSVRYRTVCSAWTRRLVRDFRIVIKRRKTDGYFCPTAAETFSLTERAQTHAIRTLRHQARDVGLAKPVSALEAQVQEHQATLLDARVRDLRRDRMNRLPSTVAAQAPRIEPPKSSSHRNVR